MIYLASLYLIPLLILSALSLVIYTRQKAHSTVVSLVVAVVGLIPILNIILIVAIVLDLIHSAEINRRKIRPEDIAQDPFEGSL